MQSLSHIGLLTPLLADPPELSVLGDAASWSAIKQHAGRYGVAALVAMAARMHVSRDERAWCDRILTEGWVRHERMLQQLDFLVGLFSDAHIPVIALKGPLLAQRYYEPAFLRKPSMDLDLAVAAEDLDRACRTLANVGYVPSYPIREALRESHHLELDHPSRPHLELHFRLTHRAMGIPVNEFFSRAVPVTLPSGAQAQVLGPADQLLHLILHLTQSRFGTLFHLYEIRRVCRAEPRDVLVEAVRRAIGHHYCGALRMMDVAFRSRWNEPFLPPDVPVPKTWLNWRLTPKLYRTFEEFSLPGREMSVADRMWARWLDLQLTDRPADAWRGAAFFLETARYSLAHSWTWKPKQIRYSRQAAVPDDDASPQTSTQVR